MALPPGGILTPKEPGQNPQTVTKPNPKGVSFSLTLNTIRGSARFKSLHSRVKAKNLKKIGKARVAVARELAETIFLVLNRKVPFLENPPCRPGTGAKIHPNRASQERDDAAPVGVRENTHRVQAE